jgi:cysteinyl-tRNA synthetase
MGERRLRILEETLPDSCGILGIDEHTACIIDVEEGSLSVRGRGRVIWRSGGTETHWRAGDVVSLDAVASGRDTSSRGPGTVESPVASADGGDGDGDGTSPFMEEVVRARAAALRSLDTRDPDGAASAILAMETAIHEWSRDTLQSDEPDRAREALRELVVRLADLARAGVADPRSRLAPLVDELLTLREAARISRRFDDADHMRDAILAAGVAIHDTPQGSTWNLEGSDAAGGD